MSVGQKIIFHGGWRSDGQVCLECGFPCGFQRPGILTKLYFDEWKVEVGQIVQNTELLTAQLETGATVYGYAQQFVAK